MNSWLILLFLLLGNQNGRNNDGDCGYDSDGQYRSGDWNGGRNGDFGRGRNRDDDNDCDSDNDRSSRGFNNNNNESRFEPRFDARPFNNSDCGCDNQ